MQKEYLSGKTNSIDLGLIGMFRIDLTLSSPPQITLASQCLDILKKFSEFLSKLMNKFVFLIKSNFFFF